MQNNKVKQTASPRMMDKVGRSKARSISHTMSDDTRFKPLCPRCGELRCFIHIYAFVFALKTTRAALHGDRYIRGHWLSICPICDAYLLMREFTWSVPFYSPHDMAVICIADYGCVDATSVLEFGNLCFTPNALRGALEMLRKQTRPDGRDGDAIERLDRELLGPTGIPDDDSARAEWIAQLELLVVKWPERIGLAELDAAVRTIIEQVPNVEK